MSVEQREIVRTLLDTFEAVRETLGSGYHEDDGDSPRLMSAAWHSGSYQRLEDVLAAMLKQGNQRAYGGWPLRTLHWHVSEHYLRCTRRTAYACLGCDEHDRGRFEHLIKVDGGPPRGHLHRDAKRGKILRADCRLVIDVRWHPGVRPDRVELGIDWITEEMGRRGGAWLPREIRRGRGLAGPSAGVVLCSRTDSDWCALFAPM